MNRKLRASRLGFWVLLASSTLTTGLSLPAIALTRPPSPTPISATKQFAQPLADTQAPAQVISDASPASLEANPALAIAPTPPLAEPGTSPERSAEATPDTSVVGPQPTASSPQPLSQYLTEQPSQSATDLTGQTAQTAQAPRLPSDSPVFREPRESIDSFKFSIFNWITEPTALQGSARRRVVSTSIKTTGIAILGSAIASLGGDTHIGLTLEGGENILAFDLGLISASENPRSGFGANIFNQRSYLGAYLNGDNELDLPNGDTPWLHRLGIGAEYYLPFADNFESAIGLTYQRVSIRDDAFTNDVFAVDEDGNALTIDDDGIDDLLSFNFSAVLDNRVRPAPFLTVDGDILRFGLNQGFNLGEAGNAFTQITGNYTHYMPLRLFAFDDGPRVLILNVQGGIGLGDTPSYEGFNLGGRNSVRGYSSGEISTAASFLQATAEYRFPVAQLEFRGRPVFLRGVLFADFATDFGTADEVVGNPAGNRDKPGDGFGFGVGLHTILGSLYNRIEVGIADEGGVDVIFSFGDRF